MPKTIQRQRLDHAARVITAHLRQRESCSCGADWTPFHVAVELDRAGALGPRPTNAGRDASHAHDSERDESTYAFGDFIQDVFGSGTKHE